MSAQNPTPTGNPTPPVNPRTPEKPRTEKWYKNTRMMVIILESILIVVILIVGYFIHSNKMKGLESEITKLGVINGNLRSEYSGLIDEKDKEIQKWRKLAENLALGDGTNKASTISTSATAPPLTNSSPQAKISVAEPNGSMTVNVRGNMNVSEINLGDGSRIDFSGMRWTGSTPTLVTNMLDSTGVGSVTQHKVGPYEDVVFEKTTTDTHATVWVSGRVYHDYLAAYNVGTTNSPIWVEPTSSDRVTGVRIKSLGPELTVKFTVKKKP
jgi:hypothetical protein